MNMKTVITVALATLCLTSAAQEPRLRMRGEVIQTETPMAHDPVMAKDGDTYYIVMEYLRGTDLKSGIRKHGALDSKKVAQIGSL